MASLEDDVIFSLFFEFSLANFFDQASLVDNTKTIGNQIKLGQDMTGNEDGHAEFIVEALDHLTEFLDSDRIETIDGFVQNEEVGFGNERNRNSQPLFHPE